MQITVKAKLTAEAKALDKRRLDLIEQIAEVEARHEKSEAEFERLNERSRGRVVIANPALITAREAYTRDHTALETLDGELADVERELRRVRTGLASDDITAASERKLEALRGDLERQQAATAARRVAVDNLLKAQGAALAELADLESKAAAALVQAAERGEALTGGADTTGAVSARLRSLEAAIAQAQALVGDCEAAEAKTLEAINEAQSEAQFARATALEFEAMAALRNVVPIIVNWKEATRKAYGYSAWACPDLDQLVQAAEQEAGV
jgi:chromosome segregation ATPase